MTAWGIAILVALVIVLIGRLRVGGSAAYGEEGLVIRLRVGGIWLQLLPGKKPPKEKKKEKKKGEKRPKKDRKGKNKGDIPPEKKQGPGPLKLAKAFLPILKDTLGRLRRKVRVDRLELDLIVGGTDAAATALSYGRINAILGTLLPLLEDLVTIRDRQIRTAVDFTREEDLIRLLAAFSITLGQLVSIALRLVFRALWTYWKLRN